ncbi:WD repeat and SOCS box-containing protein 1-like [Gigantopelta aegis]|uniref:WD repeat and SOCS box-containing protein 1-like n=1 Tax=Gigantopelta aegis TaxID=1735272 RepID=UPI001B88E114|nr:WD repeat and SOCS box-containing protein 1-like [Gigantopelta aegis]
MRGQAQSPSFCYLRPEEIESANVLDHLQSPYSGQANLTSTLETRAIAWAPDYSYFAWSCGNRKVQLVPWKTSTKPSNNNINEKDEDTCQQPRLLDCGEHVFALAFGASKNQQKAHKSVKVWTRFNFNGGLILATGLQSGKIKLWNCSTGQLLMELLDHKDVVRDLDFTVSGDLHLASASQDGSIKLWDMHMDGNMYHTIRPKCHVVYGCHWSYKRKHLACVGDSKCVMLYDAKDVESFSNEPRKLVGHHHNVVSCDFSKDGALLATASYDTRVIIWDTDTGDAICDLHHLFPPPRLIYASGANDHFVRSVSFSCNTTHVVTVADDGYVRFWSLWHDGDPESIAENHNALCCKYSPDGAMIAVGGRDGTVDFYSSPTTINSLQHLCRTNIRKHLTTQLVDYLNIPLRMKEFLKYKDLKKNSTVT